MEKNKYIRVTASAVILFMLLLTGLPLSAVPTGAFLCDVHLNGATNPSLTFGQGQNDYTLPAPPFSAMFGVADTFLVNRNTPISPDYLRLSQEYIQTVIDGNRWIIACGIFTESLTFQLHQGTATFPDALYIVWLGQNDTLEQVQLTPGLVFTAEPGKAYTIAYAPASNPRNAFYEYDHDTLAGDRPLAPEHQGDPIDIDKILRLPEEASSVTFDFISLSNFPDAPDVDYAGSPTWQLTVAALDTPEPTYSRVDSRITATFASPLPAGTELTLTMTASSAAATPVAGQIAIAGGTPFRQLVWLVDQTTGNFEFQTLANTKISFRENIHSATNPVLITATDLTLFSARLRASAAADWQTTSAVEFTAVKLSDPNAGNAIITETVVQGKIRFIPADGYYGTVTLTYTAQQTISPFAAMPGSIDLEVLENKLFQVLDGNTLTLAEGKYTPLKPLLLKAKDTKLFTCQVRAHENAPWQNYSAVTFTGATIPPECGTVAVTASGDLTYFPAPFYHGTVALQATLSKDAENTASGTLNIVVTPVNNLPIVSDITPITAIEGEPIVFSCLITDPDGTLPIVDTNGMKLGSFSGFAQNDAVAVTPISWRYTFRGTTPLPSTTIKHANAATALKLSFKVSDGSGKTASVRGEITVQDVDQPPVVSTVTVNKKKNPETSFHAAMGESFTAVAKAADPDKDKPLALNYIWRCDNSEKIYIGDTLPPSITALGETWRLSLEVLTAPYKTEIVSHEVGTTVIVIFDLNTPPLFLDDPADKLFISINANPPTLEYVLPLYDADDNQLTITLSTAPTKGTAAINGRTLTYTVNTPGLPFSLETADSLTVRVNDGSNIVEKTYKISYCANTPPVVAPLAPVTLTEMKGKKANYISVKATATDTSGQGETSGIATMFCQVFDGETLLGTWQLPAGKDFKNSAKASYSAKITLPGYDTIAGVDRPATQDFTLVVTAVDALGAHSSAEMIVTVQDSDALPTAAVGVNFNPAEPRFGDQLTATAVGPETDPDGDPIDYQYVWTCSARSGQSWQGTTLNTAIVKGEKWSCTVYPVTRPPYQAQPYLRTDKKLVPAKAYTVTIANTPPTGNDITRAIPANTTSNLDIVSIIHDADPDDADKLSLAIISKPSAGKTGKITGNVIPYTPTLGYTGEDSFTYQVKDKSKGISPVYTVTLYIGVPIPPAGASPVDDTPQLDITHNASPIATTALPWYPAVTLTIPGYSRDYLLVKIFTDANAILETLLPRGDDNSYTLTPEAYYQAGSTGLPPGATCTIKGYSWSTETGAGMVRLEQPLMIADYAAPAQATVDILAPDELNRFHTVALTLPQANTYSLALDRDGAPWLDLKRDLRPAAAGHDALDLALPAGFYTLTVISRNPAGTLAEPLELDFISSAIPPLDGQWPNTEFYPAGAVQTGTGALPPFSWPAISNAIGYRLQLCSADGVTIYEGITSATSGIVIDLQHRLSPGSYWQVTAYDAEGKTSVSQPVPIE